MSRKPFHIESSKDDRGGWPRIWGRITDDDTGETALFACAFDWRGGTIKPFEVCIQPDDMGGYSKPFWRRIKEYFDKVLGLKATVGGHSCFPAIESGISDNIRWIQYIYQIPSENKDSYIKKVFDALGLNND